MPVEYSSRDLAAKYNRFARWYDYFENALGFLGLGKLRQSVVSQASGKVLEVAIGTGQNFRHYPSDCEVIALDHSSGMLKIARQRAATLNFNVQFCIADAEALPFATTPSIRSFHRLAHARFRTRRLPFTKWPVSVSLLVKFFCWSTVEVIANGSDAGKIAMQTNLRNRLAVTGTANPWNLPKLPV